MTAHIKRAVRKSEAMNPSKPAKVEPETVLPKVHVPTPQTARQKAAAAAEAEAAKRAKKVEQQQQLELDQQQQQQTQAPKKKEKKYAPEAMIPTSRFVGNVGKTVGGALDTTGQVAKGVTDTVGRTAEGALGGGVGKTVGAAAGGVGDTLGAATGGLGQTVTGATDGLAKGGPLGAVGGVTTGLGNTVGGVGKGLVSLNFPLPFRHCFFCFCLVVMTFAGTPFVFLFPSFTFFPPHLPSTSPSFVATSYFLSSTLHLIMCSDNRGKKSRGSGNG